MSKKNFLMLAVSVMFGAVLVPPSAALAQFGPPPGPPPVLAGPPPGFGLVAPLRVWAPVVLLLVLSGAPPRDIAGAPPHFSRLDGAVGPHGLDRGGQANFRGFDDRAAASSANSYNRNSYASHGYGRGTVLALCGGCGLCLWRILRLLRGGGLLLRVGVQARRLLQARSALWWKLISAKPLSAPASTGAPVFGLTSLSAGPHFGLDTKINYTV